MNIYNINGEKIPEDRHHAFPSISMFESMGVIGDSFASGEINHEPSGYTDCYNISWGQIIGRMFGLTVVNYSEGGLTCQGWLQNSTYGLAKLNAENPNQLYIIALGINDGNQSVPVGTLSDVTSNNTNSFYSYYGRIIRAIQNHAPNAIIMLSTLARWDAKYAPYSTAVSAIGDYYSLPVFDLSKSEFFQSEFFASAQVRNHPIAVNYAAMAKEYARFIEEALEENAMQYKAYTG